MDPRDELTLQDWKRIKRILRSNFKVDGPLRDTIEKVDNVVRIMKEEKRNEV